jgi:hypothetical protein
LSCLKNQECMYLGFDTAKAKFDYSLINEQGIEQTFGIVRGKKTDRSDALLVARVGWSGGGRIHVPEIHPVTKHYGRMCHRLSDLRGSFKQYQGHVKALLADDLSDEADTLLDGIQVAITKARQ